MKRLFFDQTALVFAFVLALLMAATEAPLWILGFTSFVLVWKWFSESRGWPVFPRWLTGALSVFLVVQVYFQYRTVLGQEPANTLLVGLSALKIMDYRDQRDHRFLVLLGFILISMKSVFSLDFYWIPPSALAFVALWASLLHPDVRRPGRFLTKLFVVSLPVAAMLFFAFPRLVVPWAMSRSGGIALTGFSDQMSPGSVAELANIDSLAFRVRFLNRVLSTDGLYWRGTVLTESDGLHWDRARRVPAQTPRQKSNREFTYEVVLEPGSRGYLFALNYVTSVEASGTRVTEFRQSVFRAFQRGEKTLVYTVKSDDSLQDTEGFLPEHLQMPRLHPQVQKWVDETKEKGSLPRERLKALQTFFRDPAFVYTLRPGTYDGPDALKEFLFDRRRGFCEHFAGAFATLARALEIPSRVVVGYHGGSYNLFGNFWKVSQRDAHAWTEVFLNGKWVHQDPTEWVAPLRLNLGGESFFALSEQDQQFMARRTQWPTGQNDDFSIFEALKDWLDDLNYRWSYFLLEFDADSQRSIWSFVSKEWGLFVTFLTASGLIFGLLFKRILQTRIQREPLEDMFERITLWGESQGHSHQRSEPPLRYLDSLATKEPLQEPFLRKFSRLYDEHVYAGRDLDLVTWKELKSGFSRALKKSSGRQEPESSQRLQ